MKVTIDKCEQCGATFEDEQKYQAHLQIHANLTLLEGAFPKVKDEGCRFANGGWSVQRSQEWLEQYKDRVESLVGKIQYEPWTYGWFRWLNDGDNPYYVAALRALQVCGTCYREWGQQYYTNHCDHSGQEDQ